MLNNTVCSESEYDKYLIFLPNRFNVTEQINCACICIKGIPHSITSALEDKGVTVRYNSNIGDYTRNFNYSFDDSKFPKLNVLYVHLIGGEYYSDDIYMKKRNERERNILFLLAAKLGVKQINYETKLVNIVLRKADVSTNIKKANLSATYSKSITEKDGQSGQELYSNRGAPIYTLSDDVTQVENIIRERFSVLDCKTFSYDFYKNSPKLRTFVYKRFSDKMKSHEYTSDIEYNLDLSIGVQATLLDYGIGVHFEEQNVTCERITYKLEFYEDKEIRLRLGEIMHFEQDPFAIIREVYDSQSNKDIAIYHITEYVRKYSKSCILVYYKKRNPQDILRDNYHERLNMWIKDKGVGNFEMECHKFTSSYQIHTWFKQELTYADEEIEEVDENTADVGNYGMLKLKQDTYRDYKTCLLKTDKYVNDAIDVVTSVSQSQIPVQYQYRSTKALIPIRGSPPLIRGPHTSNRPLKRNETIDIPKHDLFSKGDGTPISFDTEFEEDRYDRVLKNKNKNKNKHIK
jgi:hypothetical protein